MVVALDLASKPSDHPIPPPPVEFPPGWSGTFTDSHQDLPDLSSIPITTNLSNIHLLTRMQRARNPEFSWQRIQGDESSRVYQRFAEDISRVGYDHAGQVHAIICPQLGVGNKYLGNVNIEVTVTGVRGYANEPKRSAAVDMGVKAQIWFSTGEKQPLFVKALGNLMSIFTRLPTQKKNAIEIEVSEMNNPRVKLFRVSAGMDKNYRAPSFTQHWDESFSVYHLSVQVGAVKKDDTNSEIVTDFKQLLVDIVNVAQCNIFQEHNVLGWNLWASAPEPVDREEWAAHTELWRTSINADGTTPVRHEPTLGVIRYFNGKQAIALTNVITELDHIKAFFKKHRNHFGLNALKKRAEPNAHQANFYQSGMFGATQYEDLKDTFTQSDFDILKDMGAMEDEIEDTTS